MLHILQVPCCGTSIIFLFLTSTLPISDWEYAELQLIAKHKSLCGKDRVIGIAVLPLLSIKQEPNITVELSPCVPLSKNCQAILNVLSLRDYDEVAKEFVALKSQRRDDSSYGIKSVIT